MRKFFLPLLFISLIVVPSFASDKVKSDMYDYVYFDNQYNVNEDQSMSSIYRMIGVHTFINRKALKYASSKKIGTNRLGRTSLMLFSAVYGYSRYGHNAGIVAHEQAHLIASRNSGSGKIYNRSNNHKSNGIMRMVHWYFKDFDGGDDNYFFEDGSDDGSYLVNKNVAGFSSYSMNVNTYAGGINSEHTMAANLAEQSRYTNNVNVADFASYFYNSLKIRRYGAGGGDLKTLEQLFQEGKRYDEGRRAKGIISGQMIQKDEWKMDITIADMRRYELLSLFMSASTYNYMTATRYYISNGNLQSPRMLHTIGGSGIYYPDFETYITTNGISVRGSSGYEFSSKTIIPFSYEKVVKGDKTQKEYGLGLIHNFNRTTADIKVFFGSKGGFSSRSQLRYNCTDKLMFYLEFQQQNLNTFDSLRYMYSSKRAKSSLITAGFAYKF